LRGGEREDALRVIESEKSAVSLVLAIAMVGDKMVGLLIGVVSDIFTFESMVGGIF
jgi:fucose permease